MTKRVARGRGNQGDWASPARAYANGLSIDAYNERNEYNKEVELKKALRLAKRKLKNK